jgi:hypothetical protein
MISVRPAEERGQARLGWLDIRHSFSFGHYYGEAAKERDAEDLQRLPARYAHREGGHD